MDDRITRYNPLFLKLFPDPTTRPRQREVLIEIYRKGEIAGALWAFKKIYLEVVHQLIDCARCHHPRDFSNYSKAAVI